jgi:L-seryl-tRNA(Ser) seleniumtransferase
MRSHPLYRALRADKLRLAALEATLDAYARDTSATEVPAHRFIALSQAEIKVRAEGMVTRLRNGMSDAVELDTIAGDSAAGGGSGPTSRLPTVLISIVHRGLTANQIEASLRRAAVPVIARIVDDRVLLDLRTVSASEEPALEQAILSIPS